MQNRKISRKMQLPAGTTIGSSSKSSGPHGKPKELRLIVFFQNPEKKSVGTCNFEIKVGKDGKVNFTFEVTD